MYIQIGNKSYELVQDNKNGWNPEAFKQRYSEVLDRYDYIVGDWGYNQLRLKGFYRDNHPKANRDTAISGMADYINEYCNFGCAYFVLQKTKDLMKDSQAIISASPDSAGELNEDGQPKEQPPLREHLSSREHHAKMKQAKEASKAAAREAREAREGGGKDPNQREGKDQQREAKEHKEPKGHKEHKDLKEGKEGAHQRESREPKQAGRERVPQSGPSLTDKTDN